MPQDSPDAVDPLAPFAGEFEIPEAGVSRRWLDARDITPQLRDEVMKVLRISYNDQISWYALPVAPQDHFDWKFRDQPSGVTIGLTLDAAGGVIGFVAGRRRIWHLRGQPYVVRTGTDLCRLPEWQGRGLGRVFRPHRGRDWHPSEDLSFEFMTHPADRASAVGRGELPPGNESHDYVRHLRLQPLRRLRDAVGRTGRWIEARRRPEPPAPAPVSNTAPVIRERERTRADAVHEALDHARLVIGALASRRRAPPTDGWTIETIVQFEDHHAAFITDAMRQFDFVADRSIEYLNWRFCDERAGPFTVRLLTRNTDGAPLGYAVTRVYNGRAYLADILAVPNHTDAAEALIRDAIALSSDGGATFIATRLPRRHVYRRALKRAGFFDNGHLAGELLSPRHAPAADFEFLQNKDARIHLVLADSDHI